MTTTTAHNPTISYSTGGVFQRDPEPQIRYRLWTRLMDALAGWTDRSTLATEDGEARSPWLERLHWECTHRLEAEHRATVATLIFHDQQIVTLREQIETAERRIHHHDGEVATMTATLDVEKAVPITDAATTAAELTDAPEVVRRRNTERRARELQPLRDSLAHSQGEINFLRAAIVADQIALRARLTDRASHWSVLQVRSSHLLAHYNRRAGTYVRAAANRNGSLIRIPSAPRPWWLGENTLPEVADFGADQGGRGSSPSPSQGATTIGTEGGES